MQLNNTYKSNVAFSLQLWLRERDTKQLYKFLAYLFARGFAWNGRKELCGSPR